MAEQAALQQRSLRLAYFIIGWDVLEGIIAVTAGLAAGSIALVGFGIDSAIEVFAATVVVWQLRGGGANRQQLALRLIATTFFALVGYVAFESVRDLVTQDKAGVSIVGIVLNAVALVVMVPIALMQQRAGKALRNATVLAQSKETWLSNYLSLSLLIGLGVNAAFGLWWFDPVVALLVAGMAAYSGWQAWRESGELNAKAV